LLLPLFSVDSEDDRDDPIELSPELTASLDDRQALVGADEFAPLTWLQQIGMVRPRIEALVSVLIASEMLGTPLKPGDFQIMQLPHLPGQRWVNLSKSESGKLPEPGLSIVAIGQFDVKKPLAGMIIDGWSEIIPADEEMTAVTFHYDAPAARAPQTILLAVPPALNKESWDFKTVLDTILGTNELAKIRAIGPKHIAGLGGVLPMIYLPQERTNQIPSVQFEDLSSTDMVLGKLNT
jgi:hypothetical protein